MDFTSPAITPYIRHARLLHAGHLYHLRHLAPRRPRGWVEDGRLLPPAPLRELADYDRLKHPPLFLPKDQLLSLGTAMCKELHERLQLRLLALTVQTWHVHYVAPATTIPLPDIIKCTKDAVRYALKRNRPLWTTDADIRFCPTWQSLHDRVHYVEQHNLHNGWPPQPWPLLWNWDEYVKFML